MLDDPTEPSSTPQTAPLATASSPCDGRVVPALDDFAKVASALCGAPIALISLVEPQIGRQVFVAGHGIELGAISLDPSICAYAIAAQDLLVIADLAQDPRTAADPAVREHGLRFYAGAPLAGAAGEVLGALCVIDVRPRPAGLSPDQAAAFRALARRVTAALEVRELVVEQAASIREFELEQDEAAARLSASEARSDALKRSDARSRAAQEAGRIGAFELDVQSDSAEVSAEFCRIFGLAERATYPFAEIGALIVDPASSPSTPETRRTGEAMLDVEYRIRRADDGQVRWIARRAAFQRNAAGDVTRMVGAVQDVTDRRMAGERMEALLRLGDALRNANTVEDIAAAAAHSLDEVLNPARCGYAALEADASASVVVRDEARRLPSLQGRHSLAGFGETLEEMREGRVLVRDNVEAFPISQAGRDAYLSIGVRAHLNAPLLDRGRMTGVVFVHEAAPRAWSRAEIEFVKGVADRTHAAIAKAKAEADRRLLNTELGHRLKNMLAMIQAIAVQTLKGVEDRGAVETFQRRLVALSSAHEILLRDNWASARIEDLVCGIVGALGQEERVGLAGPNLTLGSRAALGLSLLLHELLTNAAKYGALSAPQGRVELDWRVEDSREATLELRWRELGGPPAQEPKRRSFGSRLISLGLLGAGGATVRYGPDGLEADFTAPMDRIRGD